jgi:hypothetical protein
MKGEQPQRAHAREPAGPSAPVDDQTFARSLRRFETIMDLMNLQDGIDSFQKLIFAHFRGSTNNECRISALVPQVKESYGIYRFITSMLRAMHRREL